MSCGFAVRPFQAFLASDVGPVSHTEHLPCRRRLEFHAAGFKRLSPLAAGRSVTPRAAASSFTRPERRCAMRRTMAA